MKKLFRNIVLTIIFMCTIFTTSACGKTPLTSTPSPNKQNASAFEVMAKATEKLNSTTKDLDMASIQEETQVSPTASRKTIKPLSSTQAGSFNKATIQEYMARQTFASYVFYNVHYALQSCKAENGYTTDFELGKTFYGSSTNTPNRELFAMLKEYGLSTTLAVTVYQEDDGISFVVDWDMRNPILEQYQPINNTVYMVNGYVKYNYKTNEVRQIIVNTYQNEKSGQFWVSKIDYDFNTFVYIEGYRTQIWEGLNSHAPKNDLPTLFNNGQLGYDKICEYPFNGLFVGMGTISNNINDVNFRGYWKFCNDINNPEGTYNNINCNELIFSTFYNSAYGYSVANNIYYDLKMRNDEDKQKLTNAIQVDFMDDAVTYGTNKTTCVFIVNKQDLSKYDNCIMPFIEYEDLKNYLNQLVDQIDTKHDVNPEVFILLEKSLGYLNSINKDIYLGELRMFDSHNLKLEYVTPQIENYPPSIRWNTWMTHNFNYKISNNNVQIEFILNNEIVEILSYSTNN